jgi:hypothetical protein
MSDSTLTLVLTLLLGGSVLGALIAPLRGRRRVLSLAALGRDDQEVAPIDAASEIAFDRALGKLSDADVAFLAQRYSLTPPSVAAPSDLPGPVTGSAPARGGFCHQCGASLLSAARFCHVCGTPTPVVIGSSPNEQPGVAHAAATVTAPPELAAAEPSGSGSVLPWAIAFIALLAVVGALAGRESVDSAPPAAAAPPAAGGAPGAPNAPFANGATGPAPDISNMSPTERAQRLFDRIRSAAQAGDSARVNTFLPMALAAFEMIPPPEKNADTRFSQATLAELAGAPELVRAQADTILAARPTNLLGLILRIRHAMMTDNTTALATARAALIAAQSAEMAAPRPEYARFQGAIAQAVDEARAASAPARK